MDNTVLSHIKKIESYEDLSQRLSQITQVVRTNLSPRGWESSPEALHLIQLGKDDIISSLELIIALATDAKETVENSI